eukprot:gene42476-56453_t
MLSVGGALGGLFVGLVAPVIFNAYFELPLGLFLCAQLAVSAVVWGEGVRIGSIELPLGFMGHPNALLMLPAWLSLLATVVWLVGITNAINWLDGLDGLAAGVSGIAAVGLVSVL